MTAPVRLQLSRRKGFDLRAISVATNGLPAVNVARPSKWGNPYKVEKAFESEGIRLPEVTAETAVALFRERWERALGQWQSTRETIEQLRGKNLACWCKPGAPCHADVLLDLANRPICGGRALTALLMTPAEAARQLAISEKQLRELTAGGKIRYVNIGNGEKRETRRYTPQDLTSFIEARSIQECRYTGAPMRRSTATTSGIVVHDFQARRTARLSANQKNTKKPSARK